MKSKRTSNEANITNDLLEVMNDVLRNGSRGSALLFTLNDSHKKFVCIVEGEFDKTIYEKTVASILKCKKADYDIKKANGRDNVIDCYLRSKNSKRNIFVVDHDYKQLNVKKGQNLYITNGYCVENLFFEDAILHSVFDRLSIYDYLKEFKNILELMKGHFLNYCAWKKTIVEMNLYVADDFIDLVKFNYLQDTITIEPIYDYDSLINKFDNELIALYEKNLIYLEENPQFIMGKLLYKGLEVFLSNKVENFDPKKFENRILSQLDYSDYLVAH